MRDFSSELLVDIRDGNKSAVGSQSSITDKYMYEKFNFVNEISIQFCGQQGEKKRVRE